VSSEAPAPLPHLPRVGPEALDEIAELCRRAISQPFTNSELLRSLFAPEQPAIVRFDESVGLVAVVPGDPDGYVRLLAVDPALRGKGNGHLLVQSAEADLAGSRVVTVGADPPYFLFPGVPTHETSACALFERHHYVREETNFNMVVDLDDLPPGEGVALEPSPSQRDEIEGWALEHWSNWHGEFMRAFDQGSLIFCRDSEGIAALCAYNVNRSQTLGPVASRPALMGKGAAQPLLLGALRKMRGMGYRTIEVLWVGPLVPYGRVGGRVGSTFFVYRKRR